MVDSTDLVVITSIAQTIVITATLLVFIFQFRSQEKAIKESAVANMMGRYTDYIRMLVEKPELSRLLTQPEEKLTPEEETTSAYLLMGYGIFEECYSLYKRGWMDEDTWNQWASFLERMVRHPLFRRIHKTTQGTFDRDFTELVNKLIETTPAGAPAS